MYRRYRSVVLWTAHLTASPWNVLRQLRDRCGPFLRRSKDERLSLLSSTTSHTNEETDGVPTRRFVWTRSPNVSTKVLLPYSLPLLSPTVSTEKHRTYPFAIPHEKCQHPLRIGLRVPCRLLPLVGPLRRISRRVGAVDTRHRVVTDLHPGKLEK